MPFHVVARLLRESNGITDLDERRGARPGVACRFSDAGDDDLLLLYDLMGIRDPDVAMPNIDPDARRRRLTALINSMSLASATPALYVVEDVHWIDSASESMFVDLMSVDPADAFGGAAHLPSRIPRPVVQSARCADDFAGTAECTQRPARCSPSCWAPTRRLTDITKLITERAAGNPFFAQEMVHELAERGVLDGERGRYTCRTDVGQISVPATLQAAIAARIDRLEPSAKQTINAAAVIGSRFTARPARRVGG